MLGEYTVRIEGFELKPGQEPPPAVMNVDSGRGKQYLPAKYNWKTELEMTVSESGVVEQNFDLAD